jgi:predicted AAA+ superfamily ATPase
MIHLFYYKDQNDSFTTMIRKQLMQKLEEGKSRNELIYIPEGIRTIGKTTILIEFAKKYGYAVLNNTFINKDQYEHIYDIKDYILDQIPIKNIVIDEGFDDSVLSSKILYNYNINV